MNEPGVPLNSVVSPYRRLARRYWLCVWKCADCDCAAHVAVAVAHTRFTADQLLQQSWREPEVVDVLSRFYQQSGDIISEPDPCEHEKRIRLPQLPLTTDCPDEDL
jgi:hypothetical protein